MPIPQCRNLLPWEKRLILKRGVLDDFTQITAPLNQQTGFN